MVKSSKGQNDCYELEQAAENRDQEALGKGTEFSLRVPRTPFLTIQYSRFYTSSKF